MTYQLNWAERQIAHTIAGRVAKGLCADAEAEIARLLALDTSGRGFLVRSPGPGELRIKITQSEQKAAIVAEANAHIKELKEFDY